MGLSGERHSGMQGPAQNGAAITPHDTNPLASTTRAIWVGGAGNVTLVLIEDTVAITLVNVPAGTLLPLRAAKVLATGTTATSIVGLR